MQICMCIFDAQLTFKAHIINISKNSKNTLNLLRAIWGTSCGAQTVAMLMVYKTFFSPERTLETKPTAVPHSI